MSKPLFDPAPIIADYEAAYRAANSREPPPIHYENGWFVFRSLFDARQAYRRQDMIGMTEKLTKRARNKDDDDHLSSIIRCSHTGY